MDADIASTFRKEHLLIVLANPELYGLATFSWLALDAVPDLVKQHCASTLAGRLGVSSTALESLAKEVGLYVKAASLVKLLTPHRKSDAQLKLTLHRVRRGDNVARQDANDSNVRIRFAVFAHMFFHFFSKLLDLLH